MYVYKQTTSGVTLIELIVTLALVMLIAGLSVQVVCHIDRVFVRAEIEHIRALMLYLQHKARLEKRQQVLVFDITAQSYKYNTTSSRLGHGVVFCSPPVLLQESGKQEKKHTPCTFKHNRVYFYSDGTISAGTLYLAHKRHRGYTNYYALTCGVGHTSYIRIYCYTNNTWKLSQTTV